MSIIHWADLNLSVPFLEILCDAVHDQRRVRRLYRGRNQPQPMQRDVDPLRFALEAALVALDNRAYWDSLEEQPDGAVVVSFAMPDLETAASVMVLEPEDLRELVRERASALCALCID